MIKAFLRKFCCHGNLVDMATAKSYLSPLFHYKLHSVFGILTIWDQMFSLYLRRHGNPVTMAAESKVFYPFVLSPNELNCDICIQQVLLYPHAKFYLNCTGN